MRHAILPIAALTAALQILLATALFGVAVWLAFRHNVRFDLTPDKSHVLSAQAQQVAERIREPVRITFFYSSQDSAPRREMADLLEQFRAVCPDLRYDLLDLDRNPRDAQRLGVASYNTGVIEIGGRSHVLRGVDEEEITAAMLALTQRSRKTVCFFTGHGERSPADTDERGGYSEVARAIGRENYEVRVFDTLLDTGATDACTVGIVAGPQRDWQSQEETAWNDWLRGGGRAIFLVDPGAAPSVVAFLRRIGIEAGDDLVVDERNRFLGADSFTPRVPVFDEGVYGNRLNAATVFSLARTIRPLHEGAPTGVKVGLLALSSDDCWALVDPGDEPSNDVQFRKGTDHEGPLPMGAIAQFPDIGDTGGGELAVFGDSDFGSNFYLNLLGNKDLFLSTIAVLAAESELVAVRKKGMTRGTMSPIVITAEQGRSIFWTVVVAPPAYFLSCGILVALHRRRRRGGR